jgi:hypothetical protein
MQHRFIRRALMLAAPAAAGLAMAAGPASAALSTAPIVTSTNGTAGYYQFDGSAENSISTTLTLTPQALNLVPGVNADAAGIQLCDPNTGTAAQLGVIRNVAANTFSVRYAYGVLAGTSVDPCVGDGVLSSSSPLAPGALATLSDTDSVFLSIKVARTHHGSTTTAPKVAFQVTDNGAAIPTVWTQTVSTTTAFSPYECGFGTQRTLAMLAAAIPLPNTLVTFGGTQCDNDPFTALTQTVVEVQSASGSPADPQLSPTATYTGVQAPPVDPQPIYAGIPVS